MAWVIVGLGNPGEKYDATPHNCGRMAAEFFARETNLNGFRADKRKKATTGSGLVGKIAVVVVLPDTFMNKSGIAVSNYVKTAKAAERMVVVHDDLDLPLGAIKLSYDRGSGGHKGLESIMRALKTKKFTRVRIGVASSSASGILRKPEGKRAVNNFILTKFRAHDLAALKPVFKQVAAALETIVSDGRERAMNQFN